MIGKGIAVGGAASLLGWPVWASLAVHGLAISAVSAAVALHASAPEPRDLVPIEVVRAEPPPPPPPEKPKPPRREKIVQPKLVTAPATQPVEPPAPPTPALMSDVPRRQPADAPEASDASRRMLAGAAASSNWTLPRGAGVPGAGSDKLFSTGDIPRPAGGGSGSGGRQVASTGNPTDLTSFARPLGGYQTRPRYPDSARRQGIEGETVLRFQVLTNGRVASLTVAHSAGHSDLDRAAMDAVKTWVFEPARRGEEAVVVWVTLPVRFQLQNGLGD